MAHDDLDRLEKWLNHERDRGRVHMAHQQEGTTQHTAWLNVIATLNDVEEQIASIRGEKPPAGHFSALVRGGAEWEREVERRILAIEARREASEGGTP
jgi:hypothetical protein